MAAITISSIACTAILVSMSDALMHMDDQLTRTLAMRLAQDLMNEISAKRFYDPDPLPVFGIEPDEQAGTPQEQTRWVLDDIDDYDGWERQPPENADGQPVGKDFTGADDPDALGRYADFRRRVKVAYVRLDDHKTPAPDYWQPGDDPLAVHVAVEVEHRGRVICTLRKLFTCDEQY